MPILDPPAFQDHRRGSRGSHLDDALRPGCANGRRSTAWPPRPSLLRQQRAGQAVLAGGGERRIQPDGARATRSPRVRPGVDRNRLRRFSPDARGRRGGVAGLVRCAASGRRPSRRALRLSAPGGVMSTTPAAPHHARDRSRRGRSQRSRRPAARRPRAEGVRGREGRRLRARGGRDGGRVPAPRGRLSRGGRPLRGRPATPARDHRPRARLSQLAARGGRRRAGSPPRAHPRRSRRRARLLGRRAGRARSS